MVDFTRADVAHLLRRTGFLAKSDEVDALMAEASWDAVLDLVLDPSASPPDIEPPDVVGPDVPQFQAAIAAISYWLDRMATTPTPIVEKSTFFWHGVLTSAFPDPPLAAVFRQVAKWRQLGLGDIHELMQAMAIDPAMLDYLDNDQNRKQSPNENFARELMELFTMGNGTFSEDEVVAMARAWTGHGTIGGQTYYFRPGQHDFGSKTLFGIARNWDGPETITEIVQGSKQDVCATYLAGRLWSFFAYPNPDPTLVSELAGSLIAVNMNVGAFLKILFARPEFRLASTRTALVRSPIEWIVAIMRATGLGAAQLDLQINIQRLGQIPYKPPNVSGWRQNRAWISTSAVWAKGEIAAAVGTGVGANGSFADLAELAAPEAVAAALGRFGVDEPSAATRANLESYLVSERAAGRGASAAPTLAALITLSPDFQLS